MTTGVKQVDIDSGVRRLTLDIPERRNALDVEHMDQLREALGAADRDSTVRAVLLTGEGRSFCAGGDLTRTGGTTVHQRLIEHVGPMLETLLSISTPIVAAVQGHAYGLGFSVILACDAVVAAPDALFGYVQTQRGLAADSAAAPLLASAVGEARARRMLMSGDPVPVAGCLAMGIVDEIADGDLDQLQERALARAQGFASAASVAVGLTRQMINRSLVERLTPALEAEAAAVEICRTTSDFAAAMRAMSEKSVPVFTGC